MNPNNPLDSVYFIQLPESFALSDHAIKIDPSIQLPVQKKVGDDSQTFSLEDLTAEQILSGILTVLAYDRNNPNSEYYRSIIKQARPNIKAELSEAAILKTKNEDWDLAEEIWLALHGYDPEDKNIILNMALFFDQKAESYRNLKLFDDADAYDESALSYYKDAMEASPEIPNAFFNAAFFYLKRKDYIDAKNCFESFIALSSGLSEEELGENGTYKLERAQELVNKISARNLENDHFSKAYKLISDGEEEKGLEEIRIFLQDNPAVWNAWFMLGWGLRRLGRFSDAKQAFEKARECEGGDENADTLNELAICQLETGDLDGAKESLVQALTMDGDNTKIISNLGCLYLKKGETEEARKYFLTVLELDPNDKIAAEQLRILEKEV